MFPFIRRLRLKLDEGTRAPVTVKSFPTVTFPLESLTMLVVEPEGWMTLIVRSVDIT